ncbi:MAG: GDP-mannose 4,6-dehydratase [Nitrososphaerales archaeon]|jgi:UDP-glucose 4-epimerase|nr:GDP-mannose 4,6-dehydratase [Nitrososphaerales archaeon]
MKLLITGGAGFIGSSLCEKYVKEGHTVICMDNFLSGSLTNIKHLLDFQNFKLVKGDIRNSDLLDRVVKDVDFIFNLAAQIHVDRSYVEPKLTFDINIMGTQNVLEMARLYDVKKIIHASSSEVYGSAMNVPIDENHPLNAPHPYGASKIAADRLCYAYAKTYGLNVVIPRMFNVYGPRQKSVGYGGVISIFTRRILSNFPPIVYGDGLQTRDYTHIDDVVRAYDLLFKYNKKLPEPINFGSGKEISILDLANLIIELSGKKGSLKPVNVSPRIGEVDRLIANAGKANEILEWTPKIGIKEGLNTFIQQYKYFGSEERITL